MSRLAAACLVVIALAMSGCLGGAPPGQNIPPEAGIEIDPTNPVAGQIVTFNGSASLDPDGSLVAYDWVFGDGAFISGKVVEHVYALPGKYDVKLTVTDDRLAKGSARILLQVGDGPPPPPACPGNLRLKVGVILSQTGDIAQIGVSMVNAVKMKAEEINAAGGVSVGSWRCQVELIIEDDACTPGTAKTAAEKLVNVDKVQVIIGNSCSSACLAIDDVAAPAGVPQITPSCTSPILSQRPWLFRTVASDALQALGMVDLVKGLKAAGKVGNGVAVFSMNNAYGAGLHNAVVNAATAGGLTIIKADLYDTTANNFIAQLEAIKDAKAAQSPNEPISIMLTSYDVPAEVILTNAQQLSMNRSSGYQWISNDGIVDSSSLVNNPASREAMQGLWGTKPVLRPGLPNYQKFLDDFRAKYGKDPTVYSAEAYDAMAVAAAAIAKAGAYDGTKIKQALNSFTGSSCFVGVTGYKCFDANGDLDASSAYYSIYHVEGTQYRICGAFWDGARASMGVQNFDGTNC